LGAAAALILGRYRLARALVATETACIIAAWGVAQYPYLIVPDVTLESAASPAPTLTLLILGSLIGALLLMPSLWFLFHIFKAPQPTYPSVTAASFAAALSFHDMPAEQSPGTHGISEPVSARDIQPSVPTNRPAFIRRSTTAILLRLGVAFVLCLAVWLWARYERRQLRAWRRRAHSS
jgi:hypothetical protein